MTSRDRNGSFTLPDTETETNTDTDKMCTEPNGNLHRSVSLSSMNTSTQFYTNHCYRSLSLSVSVSGIGKHAIKVLHFD